MTWCKFYCIIHDIILKSVLLKHTWIRLVVWIWPRRWSTISSLHFERIRPLFFSVKHHLREDLARLHADLKKVLPLVPRRIDYIVVHLKRMIYSYRPQHALHILRVPDVFLLLKNKVAKPFMKLISYTPKTHIYWIS